MSLCWKLMMSFDSTGTVMPTAIMSRATVTKMNMNAAEPGARVPLFFTVGCDRWTGRGFRQRAQSSHGEGML